MTSPFNLRFAFLFFLITKWSFIFGAWTHKPEVGLGVTNNANYEKAEEDSDLYLWLKNYSSWSRPQHFWSLWLQYKDYLEESQNDHFNLRIGRYQLSPTFFKSWDWNAGLGVKQYTGGAPGTTEEGFDYIYAEFALIRYFDLKAIAEVSLEPGVRSLAFTNFQSRKDQIFYLRTGVDLSPGIRHRLSPYLEFALVFSNDSLYSRRYVEVGSDWQWRLKKDLRFELSAFLRQTVYPNRDVATVTEVSRRRNTFKTTTQTENESHNTIQINASWSKIYERFHLKGTVHVTSQSSKSGFQDYSEVGLMGSAMIPF